MAQQSRISLAGFEALRFGVSSTTRERFLVKRGAKLHRNDAELIHDPEGFHAASFLMSKS